MDPQGQAIQLSWIVLTIAGKKYLRFCLLLLLKESCRLQWPYEQLEYFSLRVVMGLQAA